VGGALGYAFGEIIKNWINWRWAFYLVVPPGILLGLLCFMMTEPERGTGDATAAERKATWREYLELLTIPSYRVNTIGMTLMSFAIGGLAYWMPAYLEWREVGDVGPLGPRTLFGVITAVAGLLGTIAGGWAGDYLKPRFSGSYFLVSGLAMLLGFPMCLLFLLIPFPYAWVFVFTTVFCLFFNTGPTNTILANVTHPSVRASAFALNILIIHLFGDALSPFLIGASTGLAEGNMNVGFGITSVSILLGGIAWLWGVRYLERDTALATSAP
jgi:predicted MFS family arabinose efflux permease